MNNKKAKLIRREAKKHAEIFKSDFQKLLLVQMQLPWKTRLYIAWRILRGLKKRKPDEQR